MSHDSHLSFLTNLKNIDGDGLSPHNASAASSICTSPLQRHSQPPLVSFTWQETAVRLACSVESLALHLLQRLHLHDYTLLKNSRDLKGKKIANKTVGEE